MLRVCLLCLALPLAADGAGDLKASLGRLHGTNPVRAGVHLSEWQRTVEDKQPREQNARAEFQVADGPTGFSLTVMPPTMDQVRAETRKPLPKAKKEQKGLRPVTALVSTFGSLEAAELVNAADALQALLEGADLKEDRADASLGTNGRLLGFQLPTEEESKMGAKAKSTGYLKVWLGTDGTPFASLRIQGFEGGFMWIKAKIEQRTIRRYLQDAGRLVVLEETQENSAEGAGEKTQSKRTLKLTPLREPVR